MSEQNIVRGKRYTTEEKQQIIDFVVDYNATNGRGGQSAATKQFGISQLTIASWLKSSGAPKVATKNFAKGSVNGKLAVMLALGQEIEQLESELEAKREKFEAIKASL